MQFSIERRAFPVEALREIVAWFVPRLFREFGCVWLALPGVEISFEGTIDVPASWSRWCLRGELNVTAESAIKAIWQPALGRYPLPLASGRG
jgi:hypothetical protein